MDNYGDMTVLRQSRDMALQYQMLVLLGLHGPMTLAEIGSHIYHEVLSEEDLPVATLTLALLALRQDRLVRKMWFAPKQYRLARAGRRVHRHLVATHQAEPRYTHLVRA